MSVGFRLSKNTVNTKTNTASEFRFRFSLHSCNYINENSRIFFTFPKGHRFDSEVIKIVYAQSGLDCIQQCVLQDKSCRSVNFRKNSVANDSENCQLLYRVDSENPKFVHKDERFDYLILLQPNRVSNISLYI